MPRGGSKPGERRGGRKKGVPNKPTTALRAVASPDKITPLSFMIGVLNNKDASDKDRKWAARAAAPYVHPRIRAALAAAARTGKVTVEIRRFTDEESLAGLAELDALGDPQGRAARMQAAESAAPYVHPRIQPAAINAGGVEVQVRHVTHEQWAASSLEEIDARGRIENNNTEQPQPTEDALDRMEAEWFSMDNPGPAPAPALPPQLLTPTPLPAPTPAPPPPLAPPQPPSPAVVAAPVPHETRAPDQQHGIGAGQPQRVNGHPRRVNGAVVRRSDDEIRNISDRRRALSDYPATHPVHGIV